MVRCYEIFNSRGIKITEIKEESESKAVAHAHYCGWKDAVGARDKEGISQASLFEDLDNAGAESHDPRDYLD